MFRIGEFSRLTQVTIRMLRYYDEVGLLKPVEVDPWSGYRMYSAEQIPVLNKIIYMRDSGFSIAEITAAIHVEDSSFIAGQLDKKYAEIEENIRFEQEKLRKIKVAKKELLCGKREMHSQISIRSVPSYQVLALRRVIPNYYAEGLLWKELSAFASRKKATITEGTFSIYHDPEYKEENVDVELCACVKEVGHNTGDFIYRQTEAIPIMACTMVYGDFSNIAGTYQAFAKWLQENSKYKMGEHSRQIVHRGPWNEESPKNYLVEIQIPLSI